MCSFVDLFSCNKPDEEIGGADGMGQLLAAPETLKTLQPIGFALDEGLANPRRAFTLFYGERTPWWLLIRAKGPTVWARATRFHQKYNSSWTPEVYCVCVCFFFLKSFARTYPLRFCNLGIPQFLLYAVLIFLRL